MARQSQSSGKPPRKAAVALRYDQNADAAPKIVASGKGLVAEKIVALANEHEVPMREDQALAEALGKIEVGREIPPELYRAVAEVLAFVYRLNRNMNTPSETGS